MAEPIQMLNETERAQPALSIGDTVLWRDGRYRIDSVYAYPYILTTPLPHDGPPLRLGQMAAIDLRNNLLVKVG